MNNISTDRPNTMPGFTAEASLYKTSERYHEAVKQAGSTDGQAVIPQWHCQRCFCTPDGCGCEDCTGIR